MKIFRQNRARNVHVDYLQAVIQYTVEGEFIAHFESIYEVEEKLGIACESIMDVINKNILTSGTFRWFLRDNPPKKEEFYMVKTAGFIHASKTIVPTSGTNRVNLMMIPATVTSFVLLVLQVQ